MNKNCQLLANTIGMLDFGRAVALSYHLMQCADVEGDIVEFGCHEGKTAALMASLSKKQLWVYDSFKGLPKPAPEDARDDLEGALRARESDVTVSFVGISNQHPKIVSGWFRDVTCDQLPDSIAFAHIDGDLYESTLEALKLVYPRLSKGAVCVIDDYDNPTLKGVKQAVREFMLAKDELCAIPMGVNGILNQQAYFVKA